MHFYDHHQWFMMIISGSGKDIFQIWLYQKLTKAQTSIQNNLNNKTLSKGGQKLIEIVHRT